MLVSLPIALAIALALLPAASRATTTQCGTLNEGAVNAGDAISQLYVRVEIVRGSVSCATAKAVVQASFYVVVPGPRGWHCANAFFGTTSVGAKCRKGADEVYAIDKTVPRSPSTPGGFIDCDDVTSGIYTATQIDTTADSCVNARVVAGEFINAPACAVNFQSSSDYDCFEGIGTRTYHCTGTIETARESSIECDYNGEGDGFTFDLDD
jgi:hypothetical protein